MHVPRGPRPTPVGRQAALFCAAWSQMFLLRQLKAERWCSLEPERVVSTCEHPCQGQEGPLCLQQSSECARLRDVQNYTQRAGIPQPTLSSGSCGSFWKDVSYSEDLSVVLAHGADTHFTAEKASRAQHPNPPRSSSQVTSFQLQKRHTDCWHHKGR